MDNIINVEKVNVLGRDYTIQFVDLDGGDGECDSTSAEIKIRKTNVNNLGDFERSQRKTLRHELLHAFMYECGLGENFEHANRYGHEETTIDWFAYMYPKIKETFDLLGI